MGAEADPWPAAQASAAGDSRLAGERGAGADTVEVDPIELKLNRRPRGEVHTFRRGIRPAQELGMAKAVAIDRATPWGGALLLGFLALGLAAVPAARAGLGGNAESVARDHTELRGRTLAVTPMQDYDRQEITTVDGTRVREYLTRSGTVFGVSFDGPSLPDLKVLLGSHYVDYTAAAAARPGSHHVVVIDTPGLVLSVVKRPRGFAGQAHLPALLPSGASARDLR